MSADQVRLFASIGYWIEGIILFPFCFYVGYWMVRACKAIEAASK